jgi:hypothetical protein
MRKLVKWQAHDDQAGQEDFVYHTDDRPWMDSCGTQVCITSHIFS